MTAMWKYIRRYLPVAVIAAVFVAGEVFMDLLQPTMMSRIVDEGVLGIGSTSGGDLHVVWQTGLIMIIVAVVGGLCGSLNNVFVHVTAQNVGNSIRKDSFRRILSFSFTQMDRFTTGSLITRVTNDVSQVEKFVAQFVRSVVRTGMLTFGSIYFLFRLNGRFGTIIVCAVPVILLCIFLCLRRVNPLFTKLQGQLDILNNVLQEDIGGIRIIKACVRELYEKRRFGKANDDLTGTQLKVLLVLAVMNPTVNALMYLVIALLLLAGSVQVAAGGATPGTIMAAITYTTQLLNVILLLAMLSQDIARGNASWRRIREVLHSEPELRDGTFDGETDTRGQIEFRGVSFSYPGSEQVVLRQIDLTIRPGETVALMGVTGCGKTTLVSLIPRFYDVTEGAVLVDGVDVRDYRQQALRDRVTMVLQKSELFSTTMERNIAWGDPAAEPEAIRAAAAVAQADEFITATPEGYDTIVGERGMTLSGGQKQRLSIARALLRPADIMIFDDATSALDLKTEAAFYRALETVRPGCTRLIVAQRVATARRADRILLLEDGVLCADGPHDELLRTCPAYQELCRSQMGEEGTDVG